MTTGVAKFAPNLGLGDAATFGCRGGCGTGGGLRGLGAVGGPPGLGLGFRPVFGGRNVEALERGGQRAGVPRAVGGFLGQAAQEQRGVA